MYALESDVPVGMTWGGLSPRPRGTGLDVNVDLPPVSYVHKVFHDAIVGQVLRSDDPGFVSRVSIPGLLTTHTKRLASGQVVPVVVVQPRGMHTWNEPELIKAATEQVRSDREARGLDALDEDHVKQHLRAFLDKVYHEMRNLGQSPPDRALNYAATNASC